MFEKLEMVRMAQAMAAHAGARQEAIARNVANADTPGYKAVDLPAFAKAYAPPGGSMRATRPAHLTASDRTMDLTPRVQGGAASPNGNSVSLEGEMVKAVEVRQQHDMALAIYRSTSKILRTSLGRG
ncbi:FlgB family protein [Paracoccaceae bacterium Fryx2]|nr:FlgB family protein [Paracoccaceae bacterium Fryx2]